MRPKLFFSLLILANIHFLQGQTDSTVTLTIRQVMDFGIGDKFHFSNYGAYSGTNSYGSLVSSEVINKVYNGDSSEITYTFKEERYERETNVNEFCYKGISYVSQIYKDLDSLCTKLTPTNLYVYGYYQIIDTTFHNRIVVENIGPDDIKFGQGLGIIHSRHSMAFFTESSNLVYYKKGNEEWGQKISIFNTAPSLYSQVMTRGEVFNFDIGDVIQTTGTKPSSSSYQTFYKEDTYLNKLSFPDSIVYIIQVRDSILGQSSHNYIDTVFYTKLQNKILSDSCYISTSYLDSCGNIPINHYYMSWSAPQSSGCISQAIYKGLGVYGFSCGNPYRTELYYFKKAASQITCGTPIQYYSPSPIDSFPIREELAVRYDFANHQLYIDFPTADSSDYQLGLIDMNGRTIFEEEFPYKKNTVVLPITSYYQGVYVLWVKTKNEIYRKKILLTE